MIITLAHSKGGVGKSLLAWNIAIGMKIPIVDLDFQKTLVYTNSVRRINGYKPIEIIQPDSPENFIHFIENWDENHDLVIDIGGFDSNLNRIAISISDMIITPVVDRITEIAGLQKFEVILDEISKTTKTHIVANLLLNDVSPSSKDFTIIEEIVKKLNHFEIMPNKIAHRADFYRAMEEGRGVTELKKGKAKKEILNLINEIKKRR